MCSYGESADIWNETQRRAKREYSCDECGMPIAKGSKYTRVDYLFDGGWSSHEYHRECGDLAWVLAEVHCGGEYLVGQLKEHLEETGVDWKAAKLLDGSWNYDNEVATILRQKELLCDREPPENFYSLANRAFYREAMNRLSIAPDRESVLRQWQAIESRYGGGAELGGEGG